MGNTKSRPTEDKTTLTKDDLKDGTPPGVNPAVLLDICYWEGSTSITTHLATGPDGGVVAETENTLPNYDSIATSIQSSLHLLAQVNVHKEEGYCRRLCSHTDPSPKPVIRVIVTAETSSNWQEHYAEGLKTLIENEWSNLFGRDYFAQIIDQTNQKT